MCRLLPIIVMLLVIRSDATSRNSLSSHSWITKLSLEKSFLFLIQKIELICFICVKLPYWNWSWQDLGDNLSADFFCDYVSYFSHIWWIHCLFMLLYELILNKLGSQVFENFSPFLPTPSINIHTQKKRKRLIILSHARIVGG